MPASSAATEIMKTPCSSPKSSLLSVCFFAMRLRPLRASKELRARVAVHYLGKLLDRLLLLFRERLRDLDPEAVVDVAPALSGELGRALLAQPLDASVTRAGGNADPLRSVEGRDLEGSALDRL